MFELSGLSGAYPPEHSERSKSLDGIKIKPGKLFLSPEKTLCYYHTVSLPGKVLDEGLRNGDAAQRKELTEQIEEELARRKNGEHPGSWEQLQQDLIADWEEWPISGSTFEGKKLNRAHSLTCLDESSLKMLLASCKAERPIWSRKGGDFRSVWPLSAQDCRHAKAALDAVKERLLKIESPKKPETAAQGEKPPRPMSWQH